MNKLQVVANHDGSMKIIVPVNDEMLQIVSDIPRYDDSRIVLSSHNYQQKLQLAISAQFNPSSPAASSSLIERSIRSVQQKYITEEQESFLKLLVAEKKRNTPNPSNKWALTPSTSLQLPTSHPLLTNSSSTVLVPAWKPGDSHTSYNGTISKDVKQLYYKKGDIIPENAVFNEDKPDAVLNQDKLLNSASNNGLISFNKKQSSEKSYTMIPQPIRHQDAVSKKKSKSSRIDSPAAKRLLNRIIGKNK